MAKGSTWLHHQHAVTELDSKFHHQGFLCTAPWSIIVYVYIDVHMIKIGAHNSDPALN